MRIFAIAVAATMIATPAAAQRDDLSNVQIRVEKIAPGVAVLFGNGGNIGLSYGADGNVIVDDQFAPLTDRIVAAIKTVDADPVRFVINTHWHFDHTGGNENFGKAGAVILAHDNVRKRMSTDQVIQAIDQKFPPSPAVALPVVTFADGLTVHLNGDDIQATHVANAHTDGDSLIYWHKANVLHMGDTFPAPDTFPFIDLSSGGSIDGLIAAAGKAIEIANAETKVIPGHGPVSTRADLERYRAMLSDIRGKVAAGIAAGRTIEQIKASTPAAAYKFAPGFINADGFVETVYTSLRNPHDESKPHSH